MLFFSFFTFVLSLLGKDISLPLFLLSILFSLDLTNKKVNYEKNTK